MRVFTRFRKDLHRFSIMWRQTLNQQTMCDWSRRELRLVGFGRDLIVSSQCTTTTCHLHCRPHCRRRSTSRLQLMPATLDGIVPGWHRRRGQVRYGDDWRRRVWRAIGHLLVSHSPCSGLPLDTRPVYNAMRPINRLIRFPWFRYNGNRTDYQKYMQQVTENPTRHILNYFGNSNLLELYLLWSLRVIKIRITKTWARQVIIYNYCSRKVINY